MENCIIFPAVETPRPLSTPRSTINKNAGPFSSFPENGSWIYDNNGKTAACAERARQKKRLKSLLGDSRDGRPAAKGPKSVAHSSKLLKPGGGGWQRMLWDEFSQLAFRLSLFFLSVAIFPVVLDQFKYCYFLCVRRGKFDTLKGVSKLIRLVQ